MIEVTLPLRIVSEANARGSWHAGAKRAKEQRGSVFWAVRPKCNHLVTWRPRDVFKPQLITLTRIAPRRLDGDNLQRALKAVRDGVADAIGVNDGDARLEWRYEQRAAIRGHAIALEPKYGVRIRIEAKP